MTAGAVMASAAAIGMALYVHARLPVVLGGHGETALLGAVLVAAAALGVLLCAYLALVWTLASSVLLLGPASRAGRALLGALRVLAPQLARRLTLGAAFATATTGMVLAPAVAADPAAPERGTGHAAISATLNPVSPMPAEGPGSPPADGDPVSDPPEPPAADPEPGQADAGPSQRGAAPSGAEPDVPGRPALGWPGSGSAETPDEPVPPSDAGAPAVTDAPPPSSPSTVEVRPGDSLWSITDELLGPGLDDPDAISSLWPVLHDVNGDVIGTDPDHIEPGQVLIVPAQISSQENS